MKLTLTFKKLDYTFDNIDDAIMTAFFKDILKNNPKIAKIKKAKKKEKNGCDTEFQ